VLVDKCKTLLTTQYGRHHISGIYQTSQQLLTYSLKPNAVSPTGYPVSKPGNKSSH